MAKHQKTDLAHRRPAVAVTQPSEDLNFDYTRVPVLQRSIVKGAALDIKLRERRAGIDLVTIGQRLTQVKSLLAHGDFGDWIDAEFGYSDRMAQELMNVAERFSEKSEVNSLLGSTVLRLLAAPSVPDEAVEEVVALAKTKPGKIKVKEAQAIVTKHKPPKEMPASDGELAAMQAQIKNFVNLAQRINEEVTLIESAKNAPSLPFVFSALPAASDPLDVGTSGQTLKVAIAPATNDVDGEIEPSTSVKRLIFDASPTANEAQESGTSGRTSKNSYLARVGANEALFLELLEAYPDDANLKIKINMLRPALASLAVYLQMLEAKPG